MMRFYILISLLFLPGAAIAQQLKPLAYLKVPSVPTQTVEVSSTIEPQPGLTESERREVLLRLIELKGVRKELEMTQKYIARDEQQDAREQELNKKLLENEQRATALANAERDLAREQVAHYKSSYESLAKGPGIGCITRKIISLGLARCR